MGLDTVSRTTGTPEMTGSGRDSDRTEGVGQRTESELANVETASGHRRPCN